MLPPTEDGQVVSKRRIKSKPKSKFDSRGQKRFFPFVFFCASRAALLAAVGRAGGSWIADLYAAWSLAICSFVCGGDSTGGIDGSSDRESRCHDGASLGGIAQCHLR